MNNNSKTIAIIALVLAIVGLGIGFAAFSTTLTISSSATVNPDSTVFTGNVGFDTTVGSCAKVSGTSTDVTGVAGTVTLTQITGASATLTEPGDAVVCTYRTKNTSPYDAYLNAITYGASPYSTKLTCAPKTDGVAAADRADATLVNNACAGITVTTQVGGTGFGAGTGRETATITSAANNSLTNISSHTMAKTSGTENVYVKFEYNSNATARADGPFIVTIPTIGITYATAE